MPTQSTPAHPISPEELQARLAAIVSSSDDAIIAKNLDGIVQSWNAAAERIFGYTAQEMIGQPLLRLFPPDRIEEETDILNRIRRGERVDHIRTVRIRKDGTPIHISATISPICDATGRIVGASKVARDITRSGHLEGIFQAIINSSDDAIISKTLQGIVLSWNAGAQRIFGYTAEEMIGQTITRLFPPDRMDEEPRILDRIRHGERVDHFETRRVRKDGRFVDVSVTISPIKDPTGQIVGASKIARDITAYKQILQDRENLFQSEQAARLEAERTNRAKDEFLATLSHELRTPLNAILGWAQLLRTGASDPDDLQQGLETIERNARIQTQLIEELLDMSRIISGKVRLDVQRVDLTQIISSAVESMRPAAELKGVRLQQVLDPSPGPVTGDPSRLQQVMWNLLTNATKFTPRGGRIQVFLQRVNSHIEITVSDTGQGFPPEFLPYLFTRFAQADSSSTRKHGGLGLGLAIVRHLIELHGGTVRASSRGVNQGATFVITLPLTIADVQSDPSATHPRAQMSAHTAAPAVDLTGITVLVVDDEPDARQLIKRILESSKATVHTADSVATAFDALTTHRPDVLLTDIGMPEADGYELLAKVRALSPEAGGSTPAVALTAFARSEDRRRALMAGFQLHVPKPVEPAELLAVIASVANCINPRQNT